MTAVNLNRALVLESPVRTPDGAGGFVESWSALGTAWADVTARTALESAGEDGALALSAYRILVRGAPVGATNRPRPGQRFRDGARLFRILGVAEADPMARHLVCTCEEEVSP